MFGIFKIAGTVERQVWQFSSDGKPDDHAAADRFLQTTHRYESDDREYWLNRAEISCVVGVLAFLKKRIYLDLTKFKTSRSKLNLRR